MNEKVLFESLNAIDDAILIRSEQNFIKKRTPRISVILIAAALAALLMGAGLAAMMYGDNIQNWFGHYWELVTGQEMSEKQTALIDHLTQNIGLSQTVDGVTVSIDSATVGMDTFYLLLRVEGARLSERYDYGFRHLDMIVSPDPLAEFGGLGSYGPQYHGIDGDGAALILLHYDYVTSRGYVEDTRPLDITITLNDFCKRPHVNERKILAKGTWDFHFTLERNQLPGQIALPDTEVMVADLEHRKDYTEVSVTFTDMILTNTGLQFMYDYRKGTLHLVDGVEVILKSGVSIGVSGGTGTPLEDSGLLFCSYKWVVPVNLEEVSGVRIGKTIIPVN